MHGQHILRRLPPSGEGQVLLAQVLWQVLLQVMYSGWTTAEHRATPRPAAAAQASPSRPLPLTSLVVTYPNLPTCKATGSVRVFQSGLSQMFTAGNVE